MKYDPGKLLDECVKFHGHLCFGQPLGVRLALAACNRLGITDPRNSRDLIVIVENNRCIADAVAIVTGMRLGRKTLQLMNYGKMAITAIDDRDFRAFRVSVKRRRLEPIQKEVQERKLSAEERRIKYDEILTMPEEELLNIKEVVVDRSTIETPGKPHSIGICPVCDEIFMDGKGIETDMGTLCRPCAGGGYYK